MFRGENGGLGGDDGRPSAGEEEQSLATTGEETAALSQAPEKTAGAAGDIKRRYDLWLNRGLAEDATTTPGAGSSFEEAAAAAAAGATKSEGRHRKVRRPAF